MKTLGYLLLAYALFIMLAGQMPEASHFVRSLALHHIHLGSAAKAILVILH